MALHILAGLAMLAVLAIAAHLARSVGVVLLPLLIADIAVVFVYVVARKVGSLTASAVRALVRPASQGRRGVR